MINSILSTDALTRAEQELKWIEQEGINHLFYADIEYPMRLKQCEDAPLNLFYKGNIDWENDKFISIVGTRKATNFGKSFTDKLVKDLAPYNHVIVSGLAHGIDGAAHKADLKYGLKTIADLRMLWIGFILQHMLILLKQLRPMAVCFLII